MKLFHECLRELLSINHYLENHSIEFLTIECPLPDAFKNLTVKIPSYSLGLYLRREYRHLQMGIQACSVSDADSIFVLEAYNQHLLFLLPLLAITGKNIFIAIHGNQQFANEHFIKCIGLKYLQFFLKNFKNFKAVLFELDDSDYIEERLRFPEGSKVTIPMPIISTVEPRCKLGEKKNDQDKIKIGLVGMIRPDKPIAKILPKLQAFIDSHREECELIIGTPLSSKTSYLNDLGIAMMDTTNHSDYLGLLREIDILVADFDRERYYYRASGVITDAASSGCYIIAPDYPIIKHQLTWPVIVGSTFTDLDRLDTLLEQAIEHIKTIGNDNHWRWREKRSAEYISRILNSEIN